VIVKSDAINRDLLLKFGNFSQKLFMPVGKTYFEINMVMGN